MWPTTSKEVGWWSSQHAHTLESSTSARMRWAVGLPRTPLRHQDSSESPHFRLMDGIFQWVYSCPRKRFYVFDMPRGMKKDKLEDFYSGIEVIKNGIAYDKRYTANKIRFNSKSLT